MACLELAPDNQEVQQYRWIYKRKKKKKVHPIFIYYTFVHRFEVSYRGLDLEFARALLQRTLRVAILETRIQCIQF